MISAYIRRNSRPIVVMTSRPSAGLLWFLSLIAIGNPCVRSHTLEGTPSRGFLD
jgi:hypothetical protein